MSDVRKSDINLGTGQMVAFLSNMLDLTKKRQTDLEKIGDNIYKQLLQTTKNQIVAIANTAKNSTANDLFIDALNAYDRELYSEFPLAEELFDRILDCIDLFRIAHGKSAQGKETFFDNALEKALSDLSFQRKPQFIHYDSYMSKKSTPKLIPYKDE